MEYLFLIPILYILFIHWIADFVFQSDYIAKNKSIDVLVLLLHTVIYIAVFIVGYALIYYIWTDYYIMVRPIMVSFLAFNFVLHFITDFITSKISAYFHKSNQRHWFFVTIGFDQFIHQFTLLFSFIYLVMRIHL